MDVSASFQTHKLIYHEKVIYLYIFVYTYVLYHFFREIGDEVKQRFLHMTFEPLVDYPSVSGAYMALQIFLNFCWTCAPAVSKGSIFGKEKVLSKS